MITLAFTVEISCAEGRCTVTVTDAPVGDSPDERAAFLWLSKESNHPGNAIHKGLVRLCHEKGITEPE